jgi:hypothetical protein
VVFFEKLTLVFERIADSLPQYHEIMQIFKENPSPRLKSALIQVYVDFFQFFQGVARVFTNDNGSKDSTSLNIA